jgi:hypothetical protein
MSFEHTVQRVGNAPGDELKDKLKETGPLGIVILFSIFVLDRSGPQIFRHIR